MYPEIMVIPMREELTRAGVKEARTADAVDAALKVPGTTMLVVNSICGCAAGKMRPGVRMALQNKTLPDQVITVFAGQDRDAEETAVGVGDVLRAGLAAVGPGLFAVEFREQRVHGRAFRKVVAVRTMVAEQVVPRLQQ